MESLLERVDHNSRAQAEELTAQLHGKTSEVGGLQLENERLKVSRKVDMEDNFCEFSKTFVAGMQ